MNEQEIKIKVVNLIGLLKANNEPAATAIAIELAVQVLVDLHRIANAAEMLVASRNPVKFDPSGFPFGAGTK